MSKKAIIITLSIIGAITIGTGIYLLARERKMTLGSKEANDALGEMEMY